MSQKARFLIIKVATMMMKKRAQKPMQVMSKAAVVKSQMGTLKKVKHQSQWRLLLKHGDQPSSSDRSKLMPLRTLSMQKYSKLRNS